MKIRPLLDRVLIKPIEHAKTSKGGIIIPDTVKAELHESQTGRVLAVGPGARNKDMVCVPMDTKPGDLVMFEKYSGNEVEVDGEKLVIIRDSSIICTLSEA
jgi:chaperonin GroES